MQARPRGLRDDEKPQTHIRTHAPLFSHTDRVVLRRLKLGQWLQDARLCSWEVGLRPATQPPSDSDPVSFHPPSGLGSQPDTGTQERCTTLFYITKSNKVAKTCNPTYKFG